MAYRQTIADVLVSLAVAGAVVLLLAACSVEHRGDSTIYRIGPESPPPAARPIEANTPFPVGGPDREPA